MLRTRSVRINLLLVTSLMFSIIVFYFMELVVTTNVKENKVPSESDSASFPCVIVRSFSKQLSVVTLVFAVSSFNFFTINHS